MSLIFSASKCTKDSDCKIDDCYYCLSSGTCGKYVDDYCAILGDNGGKCGFGDGPCYEDTECGSGLFCISKDREDRKFAFELMHPKLEGKCDAESAGACATGNYQVNNEFDC